MQHFHIRLNWDQALHVSEVKSLQRPFHYLDLKDLWLN